MYKIIIITLLTVSSLLGQTKLYQIEGADDSIMLPITYNDAFGFLQKYHKLLADGLITIEQSATNDTLTIGALEDYTKDYLDFNPNIVKPNWLEGRVYYDSLTNALTVYDDISATALQVGQEVRVRVYNDNDDTIRNGEVVTVIGVTTDGVIKVDRAIASDKTSSINTIGIMTDDVAPQEYSWSTISGVVNDVNTSAYTEGAALYLSDVVPGSYAETRPNSPSYEVRMGGVIESDAVTGKIFVEPRIINNDHDNNAFLNGVILEPNFVSLGIDFTGKLKVSLNSLAANNRLSLIFNQSYVSVADDISVLLPFGTDVAPIEYWVYLLEDGTMTYSTSGFPPAVQYTPVSRLIVPSLTFVANYGVLKAHSYTDNLQGTQGQGHLSHINDWIRNRPAQYKNGILLTQSVAEGISAATINLSYTAGAVSQLHENNFPAYNTATKPAFIINDFTTPYTVADGISPTIDTDNQGNAIGNNKYYNLVVWGVVSENDVDCKLFFNLPSGSYTNQAEALADGDNTLDYTIPVEYLGAGFLITKLTVKRTNSDVTIIEGGTIDLRGSIPPVGGGSIVGGTGITTFDELTDTPINKVGASLQGVRVNFEETALEYYDILDNDATNEIQQISTSGGAGNIGITGGTVLNLNVDDADSDPTNEYNTSVALVGNDLQVTDGGGMLSTNLAVYLDNTDTQLTQEQVEDYVGGLIVDGANNFVNYDDGLGTLQIDVQQIDYYLKAGNAAILIDSVSIINFGGNNEKIYTINGIDPTITDLISGNRIATYTSTNGVQEVNETVTSIGLNANSLDYTDESGVVTNVDLSSYLDNTDAQDLTLVGNTLAISNDPNTDVDLTPYLDNTDTQLTDGDITALGYIKTEVDGSTTNEIQSLTFSSNTLGLTLDATTVDLSGLVEDEDNEPFVRTSQSAPTAGTYYTNSRLAIGTSAIGSADLKIRSADPNIQIERVNGGLLKLVSDLDGSDIDFQPTDAAEKLNIQRDGVDQMTFLESGYVGIGDTDPVEKLEVNGAIKLGSTANSNNGTVRYTGTDFEGYTGGAWESLTSGGTPFTPTSLLVDYGFTDNSTNWDNAFNWGDHSTEGYLTSNVWSTNGTYAYYNANNVGIGTTTPTEKLEVVGRSFFDGNIGINRAATQSSLDIQSAHTSAYAAALRFFSKSSTTGSWARMDIINDEYDVSVTGGGAKGLSFYQDHNGKSYINNLSSKQLIFLQGSEKMRLSGGYLGIGTTAPLERLDVNGAIKIGTTTATNNGAIRYTGTDFEGRKSGSWISLTTDNVNDSDSDPTNELPGIQSSNFTGKTGDFWITSSIAYIRWPDGLWRQISSEVDELQTLSEVLTEGNDGGALNIVNVDTLGIGTAAPRSQLHIQGFAPRIEIDDLSSSSSYVLEQDSNNFIMSRRNNGATVTNNIITSDLSGNVGIGTLNASEKLDINGNLEVNGTIKMVNGTSLDGKVLTSDANGVGTWQTPSGSSLWTENGADVYRPTGNVGIGTTAPTEKLHVVGSALFDNGSTTDITGSTILQTGGGGTLNINTNATNSIIETNNKPIRIDSGTAESITLGSGDRVEALGSRIDVIKSAGSRLNIASFTNSSEIVTEGSTDITLGTNFTTMVTLDESSGHVDMNAVLVLRKLAADPTTNLEGGMIYFNTTNNAFRKYDGTTWTNF